MAKLSAFAIRPERAFGNLLLQALDGRNRDRINVDRELRPKDYGKNFIPEMRDLR